MAFGVGAKPSPSLSLPLAACARASSLGTHELMLMPPLPVVRLPLPPSAAHAAPTAQWPRALRHRGGGGIEARGDGRGRGRRGVVCAMAAGEAGPGPGPAPSRTQMIMDKISSGEEVGGAGGAYSYNALKRLDQIWSSICEAQSDSKVPEVVTRVQGPLVDYDLGDGSEIFDVLVCGGTLERTRVEHFKKRAYGTCRSWHPF